MAGQRRVPEKSRITIRALASAYILYLGYQLIRDFGDVPANQKIGIGIAAVAFIIIPVYILYTCWRDYRELQAAEQEARLQEPLPEPEHEQEYEDLLDKEPLENEFLEETSEDEK